MNKAVSYIFLVWVICGICACNRLHKFNDTITLGRNDKIPYGTYAAYHLLQKEFPNAHIETNRKAPPEWQNLTSDSGKQVLIIVTKTFEPSEEDLDYLTGFVQKGNYVFISAFNIRYKLFSSAFHVNSIFQRFYKRCSNNSPISNLAGLLKSRLVFYPEPNQNRILQLHVLQPL